MLIRKRSNSLKVMIMNVDVRMASMR
jgi:hypothetical protein